jgi:hypothetical protein
MAKHVKYQPNKANGLSLSNQYYEIRRKSKYRYRRFLWSKCFTKHNTKVYVSSDCPTDRPYCELDQFPNTLPNPLPSHGSINESVKQQSGSHKIYIMFSS